MPRITVSPGVELHCEVRGKGPAIVLLNGMSQTTTNWMSQARRLAERFTVVTYDARGQGRSDLGQAPLTLDLHTRDLTHVLDGVNVSRAHLCGFSYGARLALAAAARIPGRVHKLVLTSLGDHQSAQRRLILRVWREVLERGGLEAMAWCSLPHILGADFLTAHEPQIPAMIAASLARNSEAGLRALLEGVSSFEPADKDARQVAAPTLLLTADQDLLVGPEATARFLAAFRDGRHVLIEGYGHTLPIEAPELWRERVVAFLG